MTLNHTLEATLPQLTYHIHSTCQKKALKLSKQDVDIHKNECLTGSTQLNKILKDGHILKNGGIHKIIYYF